MKTVQEWLRDLDTEELVDAYFREHLMDFNHLEEDAKMMRDCDLQKKGREKLRGYINYLRTPPVKSDEYGRKCVLFVFRMLHGISDRNLVHELLRDGFDVESYSYVLTDPAEVIGFYVADTPLTQHYIMYLMANVLFEASFFGWTSEEVNRESETDEEDDEIEWEVKHNRKPDPIEQDSPEEERLRIKAEKAVTAYFEESRRHELKQLINQLS